MKTFCKLSQHPNRLLLGFSPYVIFLLLVLTQKSSTLPLPHNFHTFPIFRRFGLGWIGFKQSLSDDEKSCKDEKSKQSQSPLLPAQFEALKQTTEHFYLSLKKIVRGFA